MMLHAERKYCAYFALIASSTKTSEPLIRVLFGFRTDMSIIMLLDDIIQHGM